MDWNEFNKHLQNRVSDPGVRFCLGIVYERMLDLSKQMDMCANVTTEMAKMMESFVSFSEAMSGNLNDLTKHVKGQHAGVSLESVPLTNDDDERLN
jgi:hypothetical protein